MKTPNRYRLHRVLISLCLGLCLGLAARAQSLSYLMKITGPNVDGTSVVEGYENQIEVASYSLSGVNPITLGGPGSGGAGRFAFNGLECVMALDPKAYPRLLARMAVGGLFDDIVLSGVSFNGLNSRVFFLLEMKGVYIENFSQQGTNDDQPIVNVLFRPSSIRITTTPLNPDGSEGTAEVFTWDFVTNTNNF